MRDSDTCFLVEQWAKAVGCWTEQAEAAENRALALR
jgi:hypothetical protein